MILRPVEPLAIGFPLARTVVGIRSERTVKSTGVTTKKWRYYLSSQEPDERKRHAEDHCLWAAGTV